jgi:hypothetical protein
MLQVARLSPAGLAGRATAFILIAKQDQLARLVKINRVPLASTAAPRAT